MLASIAEREQFRGLLVAKIQNIPHIHSYSSEKSTRFNAPPPFPSETTTRITESLTIFTDGTGAAADGRQGARHGRGQPDSECLAHKSPRPSQPYEPEALGHCPEAHRTDPPRAAHALAHAGGLRPAALHRPAAQGDHEPLRLHLHAHLQPHLPPLVAHLAPARPHRRPQQRRHRQVRAVRPTAERP